jgi:DNA-binding NarL/FixJ family response regulator
VLEPVPPIRVLIAEDDEGIRETLASLVRSEPAFALAGLAEDSTQAIAVAARELPDVALVDVRMPGGGAEAARGIKRCSPRTGVLAFSAHDDALTKRDMSAAGADGYLVKGSPVSEIITAIEQAGTAARAVRDLAA